MYGNVGCILYKSKNGCQAGRMIVWTIQNKESDTAWTIQGGKQKWETTKDDGSKLLQTKDVL